MRLVPLSEVSIPPDRQRQEFDPEALVMLMTSIQTTGLLHPIIVRESSAGVVLVAGERRIRACRDIWALGGTVYFEANALCSEVLPAVELGELSELAAVEAEFDENDKRENVTWQERAAATSQLARLRALQAEARGLPEPTVADLAAETRGSSEGGFQESTRRELIVARHFADPEVAGAKTLDDAFKHLRKQEETKQRTELAARVGATFTADLHNLFNADSEEWLREQPGEQFDVILTDPPYGMGADEFGDSGRMSMSAHSYDDSEETMRKILNWLPNESFRLAKPLAHLYLFCDIDWFSHLRAVLGLAGWQVHRTPLIWHKPNGARAPWPDQGPQRKWEMILYAVKGKKPVNLLAGDVISCSNEPNAQLGAQKPVELYKELLKRSVKPGDRVADFFCGTGPIFPAAHALKCSAVGIEKIPATYTIAMDRINKLKGGK